MRTRGVVRSSVPRCRTTAPWRRGPSTRRPAARTGETVWRKMSHCQRPPALARWGRARHLHPRPPRVRAAQPHVADRRELRRLPPRAARGRDGPPRRRAAGRARSRSIWPGASLPGAPSASTPRRRGRPRRRTRGPAGGARRHVLRRRRLRTRLPRRPVRRRPRPPGPPAPHPPGGRARRDATGCSAPVGTRGARRRLRHVRLVARRPALDRWMALYHEVTARQRRPLRPRAPPVRPRARGGVRPTWSPPPRRGPSPTPSPGSGGAGCGRTASSTPRSAPRPSPTRLADRAELCRHRRGVPALGGRPRRVLRPHELRSPRQALRRSAPGGTMPANSSARTRRATWSGSSRCPAPRRGDVGEDHPGEELGGLPGRRRGPARGGRGRGPRRRR